VALGEAGDADAEAAAVRVAEFGALLLDEADEFDGVAEAFGVPVVRLAGGGVAAEGEDVADLVGGVGGEEFGEFLLGLADAGHVGDGDEPGLFLGLEDEVAGEFAGGAAGAVGDGDEGRAELLELDHVVIEHLGLLGGARREELEGEGRGGLLEEVVDVHQAALRDRRTEGIGPGIGVPGFRGGVVQSCIGGGDPCSSI
jgi:hypothetical protein